MISDTPSVGCGRANNMDGPFIMAPNAGLAETPHSAYLTEKESAGFEINRSKKNTMFLDECDSKALRNDQSDT